MKRLKQHAEIIVFTASHQSYADCIINYLDPNSDLFDKRLYRANCIALPNGQYTKDLRIFANRNLSNLVLIDNAALSFYFQILNGIPIIPFYTNRQDRELFELEKYLMGLVNQSDLRVANDRAFRMRDIQNGETPFDCLEKIFK